jgi:hypothetical protein
MVTQSPIVAPGAWKQDSHVWPVEPMAGQLTQTQKLGGAFGAKGRSGCTSLETQEGEMSFDGRRSASRRWVRHGAVMVAAVAMVAAGCGRSSKSSSSTGAASATTTSGGSVDLASGDFGTLKEVCGPGNAKGSTDKGVTDTSISITTMSDPGATAAPGLNQEIFDAADAFVGWCNAAGGILGRKIEVHKRDAALFQVAAKMVEACNQPDFMLVGNGEALDATGVQQRQSCGIPEMPSFDVSTAAGSAKDTIMPIPVPNAQSNMGGLLKALARPTLRRSSTTR